MYDENFKLFNSKDFLLLSCALHEDNQLDCNYNAILRTIVSRMYYAVFLYAHEWLKENCKLEGSVVNHNEVIDYFKKHKPLDSYDANKGITERLFILKKNRVHCDYKSHIPTELDDPNQSWSVFTLKDLFCNATYIFKQLMSEREYIELEKFLKNKWSLIYKSNSRK